MTAVWPTQTGLCDFGWVCSSLTWYTSRYFRGCFSTRRKSGIFVLLRRAAVLEIFHFCRACRSAAVKFSPEIVHESCHGKCRDISGEILLLLVPQETKLENAQNFSRQISRRFSRDVLQLQMPNFMTFFILQTFVLKILKVNSPVRVEIFKKWARSGSIPGPRFFFVLLLGIMGCLLF